MSTNQYRTMQEAITQLRKRGFATEFELINHQLRVPGTGRSYRPDELRIVEYHRFEGESDPDDMAVVYALESRDGTRGIITDAFGPYADPAIGEVIDGAQLH
ncbi:MAG TPA: hypothetical protein VGA00_09260 [Acidiferrobacterales bacterium]|jgi:hypothetical protein